MLLAPLHQSSSLGHRALDSCSALLASSFKRSIFLSDFFEMIYLISPSLSESESIVNFLAPPSSS